MYSPNWNLSHYFINGFWNYPIISHQEAHDTCLPHLLVIMLLECHCFWAFYNRQSWEINIYMFKTKCSYWSFQFNPASSPFPVPYLCFSSSVGRNLLYSSINTGPHLPSLVLRKQVHNDCTTLIYNYKPIK